MKEAKPCYPMLPGAHWWTLRDKFKQSIPGVVTDSYLAATLNMQPRSARSNVLPYLEDIGLIDKDGRTQELARQWRDDNQYADVCKKMREKLYPDELLAAATNPVQDRKPAERWFSNNTGLGAVAVRRMIQFYAILVNADVTKGKRAAVNDGKSPATRKKREKEMSPIPIMKQKSPVGEPVPAASVPPASGHQPVLPAPGVSINLQIHISSDATPDQIDKIFESMARHIYRK